MPLLDRRGRSCMTHAVRSKRAGAGEQRWTDGSIYRGEFVDDLKQGGGVFTWANGETYEGSFYKDYRHGSGTYSWPDGSRFTGKFYLNRKEGYGVHVFPDGTTFEGLYHADERFGPGVVTYVDGRQDVGVWYRQWLLRLCTRVDGAFTLKDVPGYAARLPKQECLTQTQAEGLTHPSLITSPGTENKQVYSIDTSLLDDPSLLEDEWFILPPDIHSYSTDSDHLPITRHLRQELDLHFFGRSDVITPSFSDELPLQLRIEAHVHTHRFEAEGLRWDVAAVLAMNREPFGPKGPLELSSERLIGEASFGDPSAVHNILRGGNVHPDVGDAGGFTALIAATVNCHDDVIHLLLDSGADVNKLNAEGMSALAVCAVLYYPFQSLQKTVAERVSQKETANPEIRAPSGITNSLQEESADPLRERPGHKSDRKMLTGSQSDRAECDDPSAKGFSSAEEPKAPENTECTESPQRAERVLQRAEAQTVEAELSEKAQQTQVRSIQVLDGKIPVGAVPWNQREDEGAGSFSGQQDLDPKAEEKNWTNGSSVEDPTFDSAHSMASFGVNVTEDIMHQMAEVLCQGGHVKPANTPETVRKMALMKTEHQVRWSTLKLLLDRGADPNASSVPMPVIFLTIKAGHVEAVRRLLECGACTDLPLPAELKGLYPLHVAAGLLGPDGPKITELLLHAAADPDVKAQDASEVYELDKVRAITKPANRYDCESTADPQAGSGTRSCLDSRPPPYTYTTTAETPEEGGRTALHVACQRDSDYTNARDVVSILLSHKASTSHLWSGHSPLSLAIASGNDLAVDELLASGADPNLPLSHGVGSALCAAANFNYDFGPLSGSRIKLVEKLIKAGANILMPVEVGEGRRSGLGTAVDYTHHAFNQVQQFLHNVYHSLNQREREAYNARRQLLSTMANLLRQAAVGMEKQRSEAEQSQGIHSVSPADKFVFTGAGATPPGIRARVHLTAEQHGTTPNDQRSGSKDKTETSSVRKPLFKYCYQCGRSAWVVLKACSRCHEVFYCSKTCKMKAWNERHKEECIRVPGPRSAEGRYSSGERRRTLSGKSSRRGQDHHPRPDKPDSIKTTPHSHQHDPKENYSFI
ncbi:ankyrin repeat and MYND domain-containing protein 1 [Colossoma macropomum]|uniref:ankyrin repeat and MYND domain-containing protein 1 n=1 Tax=Colossoma macropomum TaxID=42526 RepID=UPI001864A0D8|nr:ankyrin repeat and MYND domain-containing protein 1 [Colossoma macropomum]